MQEDNRGIMLQIKDCYRPNHVQFKCNFKEIVAAEILLKNNDSLIVILIYRSPNSTVSNNDELYKLIKNLTNLHYSHILMLGDFNYPNIKWSEQNNGVAACHESSRFIEAVMDAYLLQHIHVPTRYRQNQTSNILDLVFTNEINMINNITILPPIGYSDHVVINMNYNCYIETKNTENEIFLYNKSNYGQIRAELGNLNWENLLVGNVNQTWTSFAKILKNTVHKYTPKIKLKTQNNICKWHNHATKKAMRKKQESWKQYCVRGDDESYKKYTRARNQARWIARKSVKMYEKNIATQCKNDPKMFWKYVNSKLKTKEAIPDIVTEENVKLTDDYSKAEEFNKFFCSVFTSEDTVNMPIVNARNLQTPLENINITEEDVEERIKNLNVKKSMGPDEIHPKILFELAPIIKSPITKIMQQSLDEGMLPDDWKSAIIIPIHKKGRKDITSNYRPISLTSIVSKIQEGIIKDIMKHMNDNNLFSEDQHGFLSGKSTITQLLECLDEWTNIIENKSECDVIYLDFKKAFDSVPINRLIEKIQSYGINGNILSWIKSFLTNRTQKVKINSAVTKPSNVTSGVVQGSVLGPTLFLVYINDMAEEVIHVLLKLFADDSKIFKEIINLNDREILQGTLLKLEQWAKKWQLRFNIDKCVTLTIGKSDIENTIYYLNNCALHCENNECDLGIIIDNKLTFENHINHITAKANRIVGLIWRTFVYVDKVSFLSLYKQCVRPVLEYAAPVWSPHLWRLVHKLERVQRRATKRVPGLADLSYEERLRALKLPTLVYRRLRYDMITTYKYVHGHISSKSILPPTVERITRGNSIQLAKQFSRTNTRKYFFINRVVNWWNSLPDETVTASTITEFKVKFDRHFENHPVLYEYTALDNPCDPYMSRL